MSRQSVIDKFAAFSESFEGAVSWMYLDILGLVTVAIGNLIDPMPMALGLPFVDKTTGVPATRDGIAAEWSQVKNHPTAAKQGHRVLEGLTRLRLTPEGIAQVVNEKRELNEGILKKRFHCTQHTDCAAHPDLGAECPTFGFLSWPADAQLATHSMAWACGPMFHFPSLEAALKARDFAKAAATCHIDDSHNPGVTPRNAANKKMYTLAAKVVSDGLDPEPLYFYDGLPQPAPPFDVAHPQLELPGIDRAPDEAA